MALQSSGTIKISDLVAEFGGSAPHSLSEYYRGGANVPETVTTGVAAGSYTSFFYDFTPHPTDQFAFTSTMFYWFTQGTSALVIWGGVQKTSSPMSSASVTSFVATDGFEYDRGTQITNNQSAPERHAVSGFPFPMSTFRVRRRTASTSTTTTVNTGIPSSCQVSLTDYYGGRKT